MPQLIDGWGLGRHEKTLGLRQGPFTRGHAENGVPIKHGVGGTNGPGETVLAHLGLTLVAREAWNEARQVFSSSYRLNPENPTVAFYLEELNTPDPLSRFPRPGY